VRKLGKNPILEKEFSTLVFLGFFLRLKIEKGYISEISNE